jgi:hypothetical protein
VASDVSGVKMRRRVIIEEYADQDPQNVLIASIAR